MGPLTSISRATHLIPARHVFCCRVRRKRYVCRFPLVIGTFGLISDPSNPMVKLACLAAALLFIGASSSTIGTRVANVNTGTASQLDALYGVGPAIAARVVAFREAYGPFLARVAARSRTVCLTVFFSPRCLPMVTSVSVSCIAFCVLSK